MFSDLARRALAAPVSSFDQELRLRQLAQEPPRRKFLVSLSVGQGLQHSGVAVLELLRPPGGRKTYACRHLRRLPSPATTYPVLIAHLRNMLSSSLLIGSSLVVEAGASIRATAKLLQKARLRAPIQPVEVTAGVDGGYVDGVWKVAKATAIETTRQILQEDRLVFDDQMPQEVAVTTPSAQTIYQSLLMYPFNKTSAANDAFASREGVDDDLILAVALACWYAEHCRREFWLR
jgi:hypothetical protein